MRFPIVSVAAVVMLVSLTVTAEARPTGAHDLNALKRIPAWARKYNVNCSFCHYAAVPRLNAIGIAFKWAGYRMPEEIGQKQDIQKIEDYLAARARIQYNYAKTSGEPADVSGVSIPTASLFVAGPFGRGYGGFLEYEREEEGEVDLTGEATALWGREGAYAGVRVGQGHLLTGGAVAGLDRPTGIAYPLPMSEPTTSAVPFRFQSDVVGLETFYVLRNRNRISLRILNSQPLADPLGGAPRGEAIASTQRDFVVTNQFLWDDVGSGIAALAYFGRVRGLDAADENRASSFVRLGATANKIYRNVEVLGGYVYSGDRGLPVGGQSPLTTPTARGSAYWLSGQMTMPSTNLTLFSRYEFLDPDRAAAADARRRVVLGSVLPVNVPEYLRLGLEVRLDNPQSASVPKRRSLAAEVMLNF